MKHETISIDEFLRDWTVSECGPPNVFRHPVHGVWVGGLFAMYDQEGFPLADSLAFCIRNGAKPCLLQFRADALRAGWSREKANREIRNALMDSQSPREFWDLAGFDPLTAPPPESP